MRRRHLALPYVWLLTDERQGDGLWDAIDRLPRNAGVVVRHYSLSDAEREDMARTLVRRGLTVAYSGSERTARRVGAQAVYGPGRRGHLPRLYPVHNAREIARAERAGAALLLLSPVFQTRSHTGARALGPLRFQRLTLTTSLPVIALGGMTARRFETMKRKGVVGWAGIDGWMS